MSRRVVGRREYGMTLAASASYTCLMFVWFSLPAYLPTIIDDVGLTNTQAGVLAGAIPLTYVPVALFSGLAVDRLGPGRAIGVGVLVYGGGQIGRSVAPGFASLLAFTLAMGVGATAVTFGLPKLVSVLFPPDRTGRPTALYLVAASAGSAGVFAVGRPVLGPVLGGWRPLFLWSGVVAVAYGAVWLLVAIRTGVDDADAGGTGDGDAGGTGDGDAGGTGDGEAFDLGSLTADLRLVLTHRELRLVVVVGTMFLLINHGIQGWLPTFLESRGLSAALAGRSTSLFVVAYVVGVLGIPELADRFTVRRPALTASGGVAFLGIAALIAGDTGALAVVGIAVAGVGTGGLSPLIRTIPPDLEGIGSRLTGTAVGFIFAVGEIGGFAGPVLVGTLYDATGSYGPGFGILAAGGVGIAVAGGVLTASERR
ncbi:MFS transporter [Halorubrum sp. 48-1-W]|uniref:MFS transporter n=1 Tax=Halorubrum sp. 48-1-W TaxID=2249761 RepID=UPI000DCBBCE1|nr:MFS transporter [Halorubrum sp. 48-1-W]RAW45547.1 MFS transporter [Halorubrum sp. 48-1-W]